MYSMDLDFAKTTVAEPVGPQKQRTIFELQPFNFTFNEGVESFSFYVPDMAIATVHKYSHSKSELAAWACTFVGRAWDEQRLEGIGLRVVGEQVEIRMSFQVPWYLERLSFETKLAVFMELGGTNG